MFGIPCERLNFATLSIFNVAAEVQADLAEWAEEKSRPLDNIFVDGRNVIFSETFLVCYLAMVICYICPICSGIQKSDIL